MKYIASHKNFTIAQVCNSRSHEHFSYKISVEKEYFKLEQRYDFELKNFRSFVCCEHCNFCVYVENWIQKCASHHRNSWETHVRKSFQCFLIISYSANMKKRMKLIEKVEQIRIAKEQAKTHLHADVVQQNFLAISNYINIFRIIIKKKSKSLSQTNSRYFHFFLHQKRNSSRSQHSQSLHQKQCLHRLSHFSSLTKWKLKKLVIHV